MYRRNSHYEGGAECFMWCGSVARVRPVAHQKNNGNNEDTEATDAVYHIPKFLDVPIEVVEHNDCEEGR